MNKKERLKLHSILIRLADTQDAILFKLEHIEAVQRLIGSSVIELEADVKNLYLVAKETQDQQRRSAGEVVELRSVGREAQTQG